MIIGGEGDEGGGKLLWEKGNEIALLLLAAGD
jgi:hypothetical protein